MTNCVVTTSGAALAHELLDELPAAKSAWLGRMNLS